MPFLIGAALIAIAILLSSLITVVGNRFMGMDTPSEDSVWLIDRMTGSVYRCQAADRGKASCEIDTTTGLQYHDPGTLVSMANGAYLDTKNNVLTLADGTKIDSVTGLKITV